MRQRTLAIPTLARSFLLLLLSSSFSCVGAEPKCARSGRSAPSRCRRTSPERRQRGKSYRVLVTNSGGAPTRARSRSQTPFLRV